jgi:hypothetical protein
MQYTGFLITTLLSSLKLKVLISASRPHPFSRDLDDCVLSVPPLTSSLLAIAFCAPAALSIIVTAIRVEDESY